MKDKDDLMVGVGKIEEKPIYGRKSNRIEGISALVHCYIDRRYRNRFSTKVWNFATVQRVSC